MKIFALAFAVFISLYPGLPRSHAQLLPQESDIYRQIAARYRAWDNALHQNNADAQDELLDDNFIGTSGDGTSFSKKDALASMRSGEETFAKSETADLQLRSSGNVVIATGIWIASGKNNGKQWSGAHRFTDTWQKKGEKWLVLASHVSKIVGETAGEKLNPHLAQMQDDLGRWEVTWTEDGKPFKASFVMEADPSGNSITGHWKDFPGPRGSGRNIWYFDPDSRRIMGFSVGPDGTVGLVYIPKRDGQREVENMPFRGITPDGKLMTSLDHLKKIDQDTMEYWTTDFILDGQKQPDSPKLRFSRVKQY